MLLRGVPEPVDPQERAVYQNLWVLVEAATVRPGSVLWQTLRDSRRWLWNLCRLTPLRTRVRGPSRLRKHTPRNYDNDNRTSHRLRRHGRCGMLRPMRMARRVAPGVTPAWSNTTS